MRVTITPEKAQELLNKNDSNRPMNKAHARKFASDMTEGLWKYNGDPIRLSADGNLLDGQHRLQACVYAGIPFETEIIEDLPQEVMVTIDTGRRRSAADALHFMTGGSAVQIAASSRARA